MTDLDVETGGPVISRPCGGSRYCRFVGPLYRQRLLVIEGAPQVMVGGCWFESLEHPERPTHFVCNRCAHRTLMHDRGSGPNSRVWMLRCPFCGEPLGELDATTMLFGHDGALRVELEAMTPAMPPQRWRLWRTPHEG